MVKMAPKTKNKTTLLSSTFLVQIIKVALDFSFEAIWVIFCQILIFGHETKNCPKIVKMSPNEKNKTTLFYQTFLAQTMKVFLFFEFEAYLMSYSDFVIFAICLI